MNSFILLENRKSDFSEKNTFCFSNPIEEIICTDPSALETCLDKIDQFRRLGFYLVGFISYEASYFLYPYPVSDFSYQDNFPLLHFYIFKNKNTIPDLVWMEAVQLSDIKLDITEKEYAHQFEKIKKHIMNGDTYQVNFTTKYHFTLESDPIQLYQLLCERQRVEYAALFYFKDYQILSLSPELFFSKRGRKITTKPMKGTMPRSRNEEEDHKNKQLLTTDPKLIAENIMIVDLLRNDLSKIAMQDTLSVSELLKVESFETVHQMVSTIECDVDSNLSFKTLMTSLFPCGSITGVPKKRTMQIIHEVEKNPRRLYTGAIGYITPDNDMCFSVAIRTLLIRDKKGELGVGGGIVSDSVMADEFDELKLKARFLTGIV